LNTGFEAIIQHRVLRDREKPLEGVIDELVSFIGKMLSLAKTVEIQ
jgi:hypothetical protein